MISRNPFALGLVLALPLSVQADNNDRRDVLPGDARLRQLEGGDVEHGTGELPRVWMSNIDDDPSKSPSVGPTTIQMTAGTCTTIAVWIEDSIGDQPHNLLACQFVMPWFATGGDSGFIEYHDNDPGGDAGDSIAVDVAHPDYVFALDAVLMDSTFVEIPDTLAGVFAITSEELGYDLSTSDVPNPSAPNYIAEFAYCASPDAAGTFALDFNLAPNKPPLTACFTPICCEYMVTYQLLNIEIVECAGVSTCADVDADGIRDDGCTFWACDDGACVGTRVAYGDMGGPNGDCPPDGGADGNDRFHVLNCFANLDVNGVQPYPCETNGPFAYNVDIAGQGAPCNPDGVCDGFDAFAALSAFDATTSCSCSGTPGPQVPQEVTRGSTRLTLRGEQSVIRPGQLVEVEAYVDGAIDDLRGYQLHVDVTGGTMGDLVLVDIVIQSRDDMAFAASWSAFNVHTHQMVAGLDGPGVSVQPAAYLATFVFRASKNARGSFVLDIQHGARKDPRSALFATPPGSQIAIVESTAAVVSVRGQRGR